MATDLYKRLRRLMQLKGIDVQRLAEELDVEASTIYGWKKGIPADKMKLLKLAGYDLSKEPTTPLKEEAVAKEIHNVSERSEKEVAELKEQLTTALGIIDNLVAIIKNK